MKRDPGMEEFLNGFTKAVFGRERNEGVCVTCGSDKVKPKDFKNEISQKEYQISKMCQTCQDAVFELQEESDGLEIDAEREARLDAEDDADTKKALDVIDRDFK